MTLRPAALSTPSASRTGSRLGTSRRSPFSDSVDVNASIEKMLTLVMSNGSSGGIEVTTNLDEKLPPDHLAREVRDAMIHLDLDARGTEILVSVLDGTLSDLSYEISNTDRLDYRERLKERRSVVRHVRDALIETRRSA